MPNGGNWDRFWFTIMGFRAEHGHWPTRMLLPTSIQEAVEAHLNPADLSRLNGKLGFVIADELAAEDDGGKRYIYAGPAGASHHKERQEWFGIDWD